MKRSQSLYFLWLIILTLLTSCTKKSESVPADPVAQGRAHYQRHCVACHALDPKVDGSIGPAVHGSSLELLEYKLIKGGYPAGYKPKRETRAMAVLPFLKDQVPALHAYLNSP